MRGKFVVPGRVVCETAAATKAFGVELGRAADAGDVIILDGPLGAGKTTLTQGIAEGMQVKGRVTSPTFVIAREHRLKDPSGTGPVLVHVDAYRLLGEGGSGDPIGELDALDLDSGLERSVVVAEWGGGLVEQITSDYLLVSIDRETMVLDDPDSMRGVAGTMEGQGYCRWGGGAGTMEGHGYWR